MRKLLKLETKQNKKLFEKLIKAANKMKSITGKNLFEFGDDVHL